MNRSISQSRGNEEVKSREAPLQSQPATPPHIDILHAVAAATAKVVAEFNGFDHWQTNKTNPPTSALFDVGLVGPLNPGLNPKDTSLTHLSQHQQQQLSKVEMAKRAAKQQRKWNKRLKIFFCCLGYKKNKDSIADVASIFAEFYADLKVPSSDIAAGFVLLSKYQAAQRQWIVKQGQLQAQQSPSSPGGVEQYLNGIPIKADTKFLDLSTADDSHLVNDLIYYLNYSLAIFGWPMHIVDDPCLLCCIYPYLKWSPSLSSSSSSSGGSSHSRGKDDTKNCSKPDKRLEENHDTRDDRIQEVITQQTNQEEGRDMTEERKYLHDENADHTSKAAVGDRDNETMKRSSRKVGQLSDDCDIPIILEDNCCSCNVAAAERRLASHNYEIIYVSYKVNVNVVPFLVAADHSKQTIVLAIRGSMSLSDMVTDMNGQIDKVPIENCPDDWLCHRGIARAAMYVKTTLERSNIIERAMNCRPDLGSRNYTLILCGHSLGAGAAAILGVLMRPRFPSLKAYLYSPPGGILSMPVVEYTKEFAIGVILGNDTVPRLGVAQLERLRYHTLLSIKSAQKSSGKILAKALCPTCCFGDNEVEYDPVQSLDLLHGTEGRSFDYSGTKIPFQSQSQVLYVPGRLVHVVKNYSFKSSNVRSYKTTRLWSGPIYQAVWTDNSIYDRIIISEGMFFDHLPNKLMQAMKMLFCKTLPAKRDSGSSSSPEVATAIDVKLASEQKPSAQLGYDDGPLDLGRRIQNIRITQDKEQVIKDLDDNNNENDEDSNNNNNDKSVNNKNSYHRSNEVAFLGEDQDKPLQQHHPQHMSLIQKKVGNEYEFVPKVTSTRDSNSKVSLDENGNEKI